MSYASAPQRPPQGLSDEALQEELAAARRAIRTLEREARKAEARYQELFRAYQMTVSNLVKATGTCTALEMERDMWRERAENAPTTASFADGTIQLTAEEVAAIRRAMGRIHHPDVGGSAERMRAWNIVLDALERDAPKAQA